MNKTLSLLYEEILAGNKPAVQGFTDWKGRTVSFLTPNQLAQMLQVSLKTLERMRKAKNGPPFIKDGSKHIRYPVAQLQDWVEGKISN